MAGTRREGETGAMERPLLLLALLSHLWSAHAHAADTPQSMDALQLQPCSGAGRMTCIVDGDTFWLDGEKIRIADINTPETSRPACAREAELGRAATGRMQALLGAGPFELQPAPGNRDRDRYGRLLRTVTRDGESLGLKLVSEGLAEEWKGRRSSWC